MVEAVGGLVNGRYRLIEPVAMGGMGRVWRGHDEVLDREVAVKEIMLPHGLLPEHRDVVIARVMREARSAARLNHPGIITVHDVVEHNGVPVIVMEFITGRSLGTVIEEEGRLAPERVAAIGAALLDALVEAHAAGIVHRDLKPDNVLLTGRRIIITDFGVAGVADATALTSPGTVMGTPRFMPPEQIEGNPATPASDLWSLGATLYAAVEGLPPFNAPTLTALYAAILTKPARPAEHAGPLTPIIAALLVKDPVRRATADHVARSLAAFTHVPAEGPVQPEPRTSALAGSPQAYPVGRPTLPGTPGMAPATPSVTSPAGASAATLQAGRQQLPRRRAGLLAAIGVAVAVAILAGLFIAHVSHNASIRTPAGTPSHGAAPSHGAPSQGAPSNGATPSNGGVPAYAGTLGYDDRVGPVAFSPDGKTLAGGSANKTVQLWDVAGRANIGTLSGHTETVEAVAFSPDGKMLASGSSDHTIRLWDVATAAVIATFKGPTDVVDSVAFSPDGKTLAGGSFDGTVRLWNVAGRTSIGTLTGHTGHVWSVAFSPDGRILAGGGEDGTIRLWNVAGRTSIGTLAGHAGYVDSVAFSPDGSILASGSKDRTVRLWNVAARTTIATLTGHAGYVDSVAFSPDGSTVASGGNDGTVRLWNVAGRRSIGTLKGHKDYVWSVAFSPDGNTLASGSGDHTIRLWKIH